MSGKKNDHSHYIVTGILLLFVFARVLVGGLNFSWFVVAGSDFCNNSHDERLHIEEGSGYDGQFFYRLALDPSDHSKAAYGVTLDHPKYRAQRIVYPSVAWLLSLGGKRELVPFALVLANMLGFLLLFFLFRQLASDFNVPSYYRYFPILIAGLWMALARDLSEILTILFFAGTVYYSIRNQIWLMAIAMFLAMFTRDTAVIALSVYVLCYGIYLLKSEGFNLQVIGKGVVLLMPFVLLVLWKIILRDTIPQEPTGQLTALPFQGLVFGLGSNLNFGSTKEVAESAFWFMYFIWNVSLVTMILSQIQFKKLFDFSIESNLAITYLVWLILALFLGPAVYVDDWGFVRILSMFNAIAFLLIVVGGHKVTRSFLGFSVFVIALTFVRLIVRI